MRATSSWPSCRPSGPGSRPGPALGRLSPTPISAASGSAATGQVLHSAGGGALRLLPVPRLRSCRTRARREVKYAACRDEWPTTIRCKASAGTPRDDGRCPGNDPAQRKLRRNVVLGHEVITDVFELQLDPWTRHPRDAAGRWPLPQLCARRWRRGSASRRKGWASGPSHRRAATAANGCRCSFMTGLRADRALPRWRPTCCRI